MDTMLDSTGGLPTGLSDYKHFPTAPPRPRRQTRNHYIRATAKDLTRRLDDGSSTSHHDRYDHRLRPYLDAASTASGEDRWLDQRSCRPFRVGEDDTAPTTTTTALEKPTRSRIEDDIRYHVAEGEFLRGTSLRYPKSSHHGPRSTLSRDDVAEGRDLARSDIALPSDRYRLTRRPTLEREDAFRDPSTAKGKVRLRSPLPSSDDAQVAELYRRGLLYDNGDRNLGGSVETLTLNNIRHEQPTYTIRTVKRARRMQKEHSGLHGRHDGRMDLDLDLSFADLGADDDIARYLATSNGTHFTSGIQHAAAARHSSSSTTSPRSERSSSSSASAPLRVIYELAGSNAATYDVDTSQPPELVIDSLSDYDYFSDSDLDDMATPAQREVHPSGNASASDTWVMLGDGL